MFVLMVLGAVFLLLAPTLGFKLDPTALTGYGAIVTYVLTQRGTWTKDEPKPPPPPAAPPAEVKVGDGT